MRCVSAPVLFIIVFASLACGSSESSEPAPSPSPSPSPAPTSEPTEAASPTPQPTPTSMPTATTTPTPKASIEWTQGIFGEEALVDIGGRKLEIVCIGSGTQSVIFESGGGRVALDWYGVQTSLPMDVRACGYARAGQGRSDPPDPDSVLVELFGQQLPSVSSTVDDLHRLLEKVGLAPPYVLVGHSFGGVIVRLFAGEHPDLTAGVVFVDSSHPDDYSNSELSAVVEPASQSTSIEAPIVVLSADPEVKAKQIQGEEALRDWMDHQTDLASLSADSSHRYVEGAGHELHSQYPDEVANAIMTILRGTTD